MRRGLFYVLSITLWPASSVSQALGPSAARSEPPPMQFEWVREGPVESCKDHCREWIAARGTIGRNTPNDFEAFANDRDIRGATIVLESRGGAVGAGLALGRQLRRLGITTTVGQTLKFAGRDDRAALSPNGSCDSICVFVLLGGTHRHIPEQARVLVHQFWPSSKREDAIAGTYTAAHMISLQRTLGQVARYVSEMGVDAELLEIATRIPPWENLRTLSQDDLRRLRVHNVDNPFPIRSVTSPTEQPFAEPAVPPVIVNPVRAWTVVTRSGQQLLLRDHPLTIEGQQIGTFEISISCGVAPDNFRVEYSERRLAGDGLDRLSGVGISVRKDGSFLRASLTVDSSLPETSPDMLVSIAHGTISSIFIDAIAGAANSPLFVATSTANKVRTTTRLGRVGLDESLEKWIAGCRPSMGSNARFPEQANSGN
jgi:hypothetical protein